MTEQRPGPPPPGWWQASDGNWYPPETRPPGVTGAPPASKGPRPWYLRWWAITLGVLILLIVIGAIAGGSSSKKPLNTAVTSPKSSSSSSSSSVTTTTEAPTTTVPSIHAVGDTAHTGDFDVTVNKVTEPYVPRNQFEQPHDGEHYIAIDVSMRNTSNDPQILSTGFFDLTDPQGRKYGEAFLDSNQPIDGQVPPGQPRTGTLFYTVTDGLSGLVLRVRGDFTSGGTTFQID